MLSPSYWQHTGSLLPSCCRFASHILRTSLISPAARLPAAIRTACSRLRRLPGGYVFLGSPPSLIFLFFFLNMCVILTMILSPRLFFSISSSWNPPQVLLCSRGAVVCQLIFIFFQFIFMAAADALSQKHLRRIQFILHQLFYMH